MSALFSEARRQFLATLLERVLTVHKGVPSNADRSSKTSVTIASGIVSRIGEEIERERLAGQMSGNQFEDICTTFLRETFLRLDHLRPGRWHVLRVGSSSQEREDAPTGAGLNISKFEQYSHLAMLSLAAKKDPHLAAALRGDYTIRPDIVIAREPETDERINTGNDIVDAASARLTSLRRANQEDLLLHATISCKWTIRSDRVQNARSEALNLIRNRKGRVPHIVVVTGEPLPSRIASIALGTGDIDCVYHFALAELIATVDAIDNEEARNLVKIMVDGKRLRDISDLPLDLAV
jgi:hypothetical protein